MNISFFISILCIVFCLIFFFYTKWYIKRRTSASELLAEYRAEVYRLNADINAVTDRDLLLVEDRIKKLKEVLEDTDKRIKVYVQELDRSRTGEALYTSLGRGIRAALKTPAESQPPLPEPELSTQMPKLTLVRQDNAQGNAQGSAQDSAQNNAQNSAQNRAPVPASVSSASKPPSKRQIRTQIDDLVKEGISPPEIASRLGISIAEVDLAMNLMNGRKK